VRGLEDNYNENDIHLHDSFGLELSENFVIETGIVGFTEDGVIIHLDEDAMEFLDFNGVLLESEDREEEEPDAYGRTGERYDCMTCGGSGREYDETCLGCGGLGWCREKKLNEYMKLGGGGDAASSGTIDEAEYHGRKVPLGKPMQGDVAKSKVYVRKPNGKVVKVNFGDKNMRIHKSNPARRKSFRARHHCENPGPRWKARYWSCKKW